MNLCDDILINILLLLPARILHRCMRYASKTWFRIITDDSFVYAHLSRSQPGLVLQTIDEYGSRPNRAVIIVDNDQQVVQEQVNTTVRILGSCNGLVLLIKPARKQTKKNRYKSACSVTIYNPVTGQASALPVFSRENPFNLYGGIAFDPLTKEYKIVVIFDVDAGTPWNCKILTLGSGWKQLWRNGCGPRWRKVHDVSLWTSSHVSWTPVLVGCSLNWLGQHRVLSIDVAAGTDEKFHGIEFNEEMKGSHACSNLMNRDGKLGVLMLLQNNSEIVIWTLVDSKIWRKQFRTPYFPGRIDPNLWYSYPAFLMGVGNMRGEDVMLFMAVSVGIASYFTYNIKDGSVAHLINFMSSGRSLMHSVLYVHVNSLVSW